jgi:hypothetical protein
MRTLTLSFEERAQNGVRRRFVPGPIGDARRWTRPALCASLFSSRTTQRAAIALAVRWTRPALCASLLLVSGILGLAQDSTELVDKAPPPVEEALRARIDQYYHAFMAGKYKDAYLLVDDASQDAFLETDKQQYKGCDTLKIRYSDNYTKAIVVESCKSEWKWHGVTTPSVFQITSNWKVVDGQWYWHYVKPTQIAFPFSPTGFVPVPQEDQADITLKKEGPAIPADLKGAAQGILSKVSVDKQAVRLHPEQSSQDVIHVRNEMPGVVTLKLDNVGIPGLKITLGKNQLQAHEETTVLFEWRLDDPAVLCPDCAKKTTGNSMVQLRIGPTGQVFPISIVFDHGPQAGQPIPQAPRPPQQ